MLYYTSTCIYYIFHALKYMETKPFTILDYTISRWTEDRQRNLNWKIQYKCKSACSLKFLGQILLLHVRMVQYLTCLLSIIVIHVIYVR